MEEVDNTQFSLMSLEEDLSCSICLSPFSCPVTIPCGHNFCQDCLLEAWKDSYSCPQCRTVFATKPELRKNTVLSSVVETFVLRASRSEGDLLAMESKPKKDVIRCDTCMKEEASRTCLTCMASYCEEHLRPHRENPNFSLHQLSEPVGDLQERICPDHHKLMEFFCSQHGRPICSFCLQQVHKGCPFVSPEEQRNMKESDLRDKLNLLDGKIEKTQTVLVQMDDMQLKLKDAAAKRKTEVATLYQQVRDLLAQEEREAQLVVEQELETSQNKLRNLTKKLTANITDLRRAKEQIDGLLSQSQSLSFLQASFDLPTVVKFEPHLPRVNLDSPKVIARQTFAAELKKNLTEMFQRPVEARLAKFLRDEKGSPLTGSTGSHLGGEPTSLAPPHMASYFQARPPFPAQHKTKQAKTAPSVVGGSKKSGKGSDSHKTSSPGPQHSSGKSAKSHTQHETLDTPADLTSVKERSELLKYVTELTLDPKTAHKRILLMEGLTKAYVSDQQVNYPDSPERFSVSSQVLASKGFTKGRHYWEVQLSSNNFVGIGLTYQSLDRKGPTSRLGRNDQSWCVEWFNIKLSAWHNSSETILVNPNPKCVGVLLDCDKGTATFYSVLDKAYPFHSFVFPFSGAVYPAFWIFSSGSSISLRTIKA